MASDFRFNIFNFLIKVSLDIQWIRIKSFHIPKGSIFALRFSTKDSS